MPIPFHCHECDAPTMNKNGLCDKHQPIHSFDEARREANKKIKADLEKAYAKVLFGETLTLSDLNQEETMERGRNSRNNQAS